MRERERGWVRKWRENWGERLKGVFLASCPSVFLPFLLPFFLPSFISHSVLSFFAFHFLSVHPFLSHSVLSPFFVCFLYLSGARQREKGGDEEKDGRQKKGKRDQKDWSERGERESRERQRENSRAQDISLATAFAKLKLVIQNVKNRKLPVGQSKVLLAKSNLFQNLSFIPWSNWKVQEVTLGFEPGTCWSAISRSNRWANLNLSLINPVQIKKNN